MTGQWRVNTLSIDVKLDTWSLIYIEYLLSVLVIKRLY